VAQAGGGHLQLLEPTGRVWAGSAAWRWPAAPTAATAPPCPASCTGACAHADRRAGTARAGLLHHARGPAAARQPALGAACTCRWPTAPRTAGGRAGRPGHALEHPAPEGELRLVTQGLAATWLAGRLQLAGSATLTARALSSRLSTLRPMGSYRLVLRGGSDTA
jgi:general secretion pathway protein N